MLSEDQIAERRARRVPSASSIVAASSVTAEGRAFVTVRITSWRGMVPRAALLAVVIALVPLPAAAGGRTEKQAPTITASMRRMVARDLASTPVPSSMRRAARQTPPAGSAPGFFKSGPGMIALVVMAAGTGYALYSATHDRIHSPGKE
jgi:hypothetical protein